MAKTNRLQTHLMTDEEALDALRDLWRRMGPLTARIIDADVWTPSLHNYRERFGSMPRALELIGHPVSPQYEYAQTTQRLRAVRDAVAAQVQVWLEDAGVIVRQQSATILRVSGTATISVFVARHQGNPDLPAQWWARYHTNYPPTVGLVPRMQPGNRQVLDYYVLPSAEVRFSHRMWLNDDDPALARFRADDPTELVIRLTGTRPLLDF